MLVWLLQRLLNARDTATLLTLRTALASLTAFVLALLLGPVAIRWLKARFRERIASDSARLDELHANKKDTPTMGGLFILAALGLLVSWVLYRHQAQYLAGLDVVFPGGAYTLGLGIVFIPWSLLVLVGSSNGVNLTDGLDGLAAGCMVFAGTAFTALTYMAGNKVMSEYLQIPHIPGAGEFAVVLGAVVGAVLGFLWFNAYPAQVFMGDAGALPLGGLIGLAALVCRQELLLLVVGGVFVAETLSVIAQIISFRCFGRRVLACAPLHNHFVFRGVHEVKIVVRFWIIAALLAIAGFASLRLL